MATTTDENVTDQRRHFPAALSDLGVIAGVVVCFYTLSTHLNLSENITGFTQSYEHWQLDELPLTLLLLSAGFVWFAFRRMLETRRELNQRIRAQDKIAELLTHNRDLSQRLLQVQENERRALARELHDEFAQNCTAIRAEASYIMNSPVSENVGMSAKRISCAAETLSSMVRDILRRLRPATLDSLGLESALQELCETWEEQTGIACGLFTRDISLQLSDSTSITIFRLVQESLTNAARHAEATQVKINLQQNSSIGKLSLTIQDDGKGMPYPDYPHSGFGLLGMRERVAALQGDIRFFAEAGCGLCIAVELPMKSTVS